MKIPTKMVGKISGVLKMDGWIENKLKWKEKCISCALVIKFEWNAISFRLISLNRMEYA